MLDFSAVTFYESDKAREQHQEDYSYRKDVEGVLSGPEIFKRYWDDYVYVASACFHFIRRAFLEEHGLRFKEGILHEDELFTPLLYAHANRCAFLNRPLYLRRMRTGSIMTQPRGVKHMDSIYKLCLICRRGQTNTLRNTTKALWALLGAISMFCKRRWRARQLLLTPKTWTTSFRLWAWKIGLIFWRVRGFNVSKRLNRANTVAGGRWYCQPCR